MSEVLERIWLTDNSCQCSHYYVEYEEVDESTEYRRVDPDTIVLRRSDLEAMREHVPEIDHVFTKSDDELLERLLAKTRNRVIDKLLGEE